MGFHVGPVVITRRRNAGFFLTKAPSTNGRQSVKEELGTVTPFAEKKGYTKLLGNSRGTKGLRTSVGGGWTDMVITRWVVGYRHRFRGRKKRRKVPRTG